MMARIAEILIFLLVLSFIEGRPLSEIDRPYQGKEEPWKCNDDDECLEKKSSMTTKHLSPIDVQEELTGISRKLENVLHSYPGLELETFYLEKDDEIVVKAKVSLRGCNDNYDISCDFAADDDTSGDDDRYDDEIWDDDDDDVDNDVFNDDDDDDNDDGDDDDDNDDDHDDEIFVL